MNVDVIIHMNSHGIGWAKVWRIPSNIWKYHKGIYSKLQNINKFGWYALEFLSFSLAPLILLFFFSSTLNTC